jgi:CBS domain-containing protein
LESDADGELVEDVMATKVVTIDSEATVKTAASLMARRKCSCLVVVRGSAALGIVTERDLVRKVLAAGINPSKVLISDVMSAPLITTRPKATVIEATQKMSEYLIRRLVVVDESSGALVGLITANDVAKLLAKEKEYSDSELNAIARMRHGTGGPYE